MRVCPSHKTIVASRDHSFVPEKNNERAYAYTGAMTDANNAVLDDGYVALHQGCIVKGNTHSDVSIRRIVDITSNYCRKNTLLVGEGKMATDQLRDETRGQIFNELIRHRQIDEMFRNNSDD
jgi:hypothetical protein